MFQFRQSIKRIFGIHTRGRNSQTDRRYNVTITSPAHKMTSVNDISKYNTDSSGNAKRRDKKITIETSQIDSEVHRPMKNMELCTIVENKAGSDTDRSGETIFDEDSSNGNNNKYSESKIPNEHSPTPTIVDSECTHFLKGSQRNDNDDTLNIYGNQAYEEHSTDVALISTGENRSRIRHSYSLDLTDVPKNNKRRKLSVQMQHGTVVQTEGLLDDIVEL